MRKLTSLIAVAISIANVLGQGTIKFNNRTGPIDAPFSRPDGTGLGAGFTAQLFLVSGGGNVYTPLLPTATFRTTSPAAAFYISEPSTGVVVPGIPGGQQATVVIRIWEGVSYDTSLLRGQTAPVTVLLGGEVPGSAPIPDALLIGLQGFIVPEPSTFAVGVLGAVALLYRRRI